MWLVFLGFHLVGLTGYNLLLRRSLLQKADPLTLATLMQTAIAVPLLFVMVFRPINLAAYDAKTLIYASGAIVLVIVFNITNVKALQYLEASVYSVLFNLRIIITTILGIVFVGEKLIPLQILGGLLIFWRL